MEVFATIQSFNFCHFFCGQCKIEEVKVMLHTIFVRTGLVNISLRPSANGPQAKMTFYVEELS